MSFSEERFFLLHVFNFVFKSYRKEFPSILADTLPGVVFSDEDNRLTPVLRVGITSIIDTFKMFFNPASYETAADYWLRLVKKCYSENNLLNFICFHAHNCLLGNLDAAGMLDAFELVMNVINDAKSSGKFTKESWEKLDLAATFYTAYDDIREDAVLMLNHPAALFYDSSSSSPSPVKPHEPIANKPRTDLSSSSSSVEMSEAGPSSGKSDKSKGTDGKTKYKAKKERKKRKENQ